MKLARRYLEKPWGRTDLPAYFGAPGTAKIGEVWYPADGSPLLAKYIFTSERLSIQVHPNDEQARLRGLPQGKSECWLILAAEPNATIGLGLKRPVSQDELCQAALDGSIEDLVDWRPVYGGDFIYVAAGTVHAIGAGISLMEFQQNVDVTYRLYDYGRPRELHLDDAVAVANREPSAARVEHLSIENDQVLVDGPHFRLELTSADTLTDCRRWILPLSGEVRSDGDIATAGDCLLLEAGELSNSRAARMLIGTAPTE